MAYLLGFKSAVEWLRLNKNTSLVAQKWGLPMLSLEASRRRLQKHTSEFEHLTKPLHLIVSAREDRRPSDEVICHLLFSPNGSYPAVRVGRGAYCSCPAFTFLQMANVLDDVALRFLGMELCGLYGFDENGRLYLRPQTCTPQELEDIAVQMVRVRGRRRAATVAPSVISGSASPLETALFLILCATLDEGGFALPHPELNASLQVTGSARELWSDDCITPDMLWRDAKLVIEYDSSLHHTAAHSIARDAMRRNVFEELGYRVVTVTAEHLRAPRQIEHVASIVARCTGTQIESLNDEMWNRRVAWQLRIRDLAEHPEELLGPTETQRKQKRSWHARGHIR